MITSSISRAFPFWLTMSLYLKVLNSAIRYNLNESFTLVGQIHNLLDETYTSSTKVVNFIAGVPNRGRTYSLGIEMRF